MPSSFSGKTGSLSARTSNPITYGICIAIMLVALLAVSLVKRRGDR
ncbi:MAG: hypothetical protein J6U30_01310 [Oscillospiraceae bacterium]|nr:hypothetical protein [Oscillospiraceae bacterium]